jgi:hypothetical protein
MAPTITILTPEQIAERQTRLLAGTGLTYDELRARGETYQLSPEQAAALRELEDLRFLAGE